MLEQLIRDLGVRKVARATGANPCTVLYWCRRGLPSATTPMKIERRQHYEREIAKLAGMKVGELRKQLKAEEAAKAA